MKSPPGNSSKEAKALRIAAERFAAHLKTPPSGSTDPIGQRLNAALLGAAVAYSRAHDALVKTAAEPIRDVRMNPEQTTAMGRLPSDDGRKARNV